VTDEFELELQEDTAGVSPDSAPATGAGSETLDELVVIVELLLEVETVELLDDEAMIYSLFL